MQRSKRDSGLVTASEIACWVYCPEQWRLQYGLGLEAQNQAVIDRGSRHHAAKAVAERIAGAAFSLGRVLVVLAVVTLLLWMVSAFAFARYLGAFAGAYVRTYAGLASAMVALVFLYWTAGIFVYGGELNEAIRRERESL